VHADVIVVGLGSMGAAAVHHLAARGVSVLGVDRFTPPHGRGAHAGGSRIIRLAYAEGPAYVPLLARAYRLWDELTAATGEPMLTRTGGLMLGAPAAATVAGALASARAHGLPYELLDAAQVRLRFPAFAPADHEVALFDEAAGLVRPERAISAYLRLAAAAGARLCPGVAVTGWQARADGVTVTTSDGRFDAGRLVLCPGPWAGRLLTDLGVPLRVERRVQHYWRGTPGVHSPPRFPVWIWEYAPGAAAYGLPAAGGTGLDAGGTGLDAGVKVALHHGDDPADPDVGAGEPTPADIDAVRGWMRTRLPGLAAADWLGGKPCLYTLTPDEHFVLGRHPQHPAVVLGCGFSGHGFKFAPVVGEVLADLALDGATALPIDPFAPDRFAAPGDTRPGSDG
jgi:sarcosine oxidase